MASPNLLQQLHHLDRYSSGFHDQLSNILYREGCKQDVEGLQNDGLVWLVNYLDEALDILDPSSSAFRKCLREIRSICGSKAILPTSYVLSSPLLNIGRNPVASGGSGDVFEGNHNGLKVCVKRIRIYSKDGPKKAIKTFYQEAVVCKHLAHPNIVPLLGITPDPLQLISEWMPGGDLRDFIKKHPGADRLGLLSDVAQGLYYLHTCNIIHGDLKGPNILVDATGCARITDFGLATVTQNLDSIRSASDERGHTARWTAPEILNEEGTHSKEADIFAFAMVTIEVFTGAIPFKNVVHAAATLAIMNGQRPPRPTHPAFTDQLWTLIQRCWDQKPHLRPEVSKVLKFLCGSEPPPIKPFIYNPVSTSTGQQQIPVFPPPPPSTPSSPPRLKPQTTPQKSNRSTDATFPESRGGSTGPCERENAWPHGTFQGPIQYPPPVAGSYLPDEQQGGQSGERTSRKPSRRNKATSEHPSPIPIGPQPFDPGELKGGQASDQVYGHTSGVGKPRTDLPNTLGGRKPSKRDAGSKGSRSDLIRDMEDNDQGKYWSGERRDNHGASRDGRYQGGQSRNTSRAHLPNNPSRDHLARYNQSRTDSQSVHGDRNTSRGGVSGKDPRLGLDHGVEDNDEAGWSGSWQNNRGTSRDGHYQGGQSRNPSHMHLPNSPPRDYLAQYNQSGAGTNPHVEDRAGSRYELSNMGDGALSRRTSKRNNPGVNAGYTTSNVSHHDLRTGNKPRNESRADFDGDLPQDPGPQTDQDRQGRPQRLEEPAGASIPRLNGSLTNDNRGVKQERKGQNSSDNTLDHPKVASEDSGDRGTWNSIKKNFCGCR